MLLFLTLILTFVPAIFWLAIFLRKDRIAPEPKRLIFLIFILGAISALFAGALETEMLRLLPKNLFLEFIVSTTSKVSSNFSLVFILILLAIAFIEEVTKIAVVRFFALNSKHFNQVVDGAIFGITSGLGFAALENSGYLSQAARNQNLPLLLVLFSLRLFGSSLLHAITTGISGYYLGKLKFGGSYLSFLTALLGVILLHTSFNLFLFGNLLGLIVQVLLLVILLIFLLKSMGAAEAQYIRKIISLRSKNP